LASLLLACACTHAPSELPRRLNLELPGSDGRPHDIADELRRAELSVFIFYAEHCATLDAHAQRIAALDAAYRPRGVAFRFVNSEVAAEPGHDAEVARARGYAFPLLTDRGARLADALGAEFATHTVVVEPDGRIAYSGGIDSDMNRLHDSARHYLRDALEALLAGQKPQGTHGEALGCALRLH
jgi:peroxiredoxin